MLLTNYNHGHEYETGPRIQSCQCNRSSSSGHLGTMATLGLSRLLPKPTQTYQVHKDDPSPTALARLEVRAKVCPEYDGLRLYEVARKHYSGGDMCCCHTRI